MLKIVDSSNSSIYHPLGIPGEDWFITHKYEGNDSLTFEIPANHEAYKYISEEIRILDGQNRYIVKNIDEHGNVVVVDCELDVDDWKINFYKEYRATNAYLEEVLGQIKPAGWSVSGAGISTIRATIEASEGMPLENVTSLDILQKSMGVYGVVVNYDAINKRLNVEKPETYTAGGKFFTDELNLRSIGYVGNSSDFATRLYAYGKSEEGAPPFTFASINGGKEYVEDFSYSSRVISVGWKDDRYTVKENLLAAAKKKLTKLAYPERSYECDVRNLDGDMWMYKVVTLIDKRRKTRVDHRVVEYREYPEKHSMDVVTLSATAPRIEGNIKQIRTDMEQQHADTHNFMVDAINNATDIITGTKGGHVVTKLVDGKPEELLILDTDNINTAKNLWRFNLGGLGHSKNGINGPYGIAITNDGAIVADRITVGTMLANRIRGGTLELGGISNASGILRILGADGGKEIGRWDSNGIRVDKGRIGNANIQMDLDNFIFKSNSTASIVWLSMSMGIISGGLGEGRSSGSILFGEPGRHGDCILLKSDKAVVLETNNLRVMKHGGSVAYVGWTGEKQFVSDIKFLEEGRFQYTLEIMRWVNGVMVTAFS